MHRLNGSRSMSKKIVFLTGTRADFGKLKSLMKEAEKHFDVYIFVTGMHMFGKYGSTGDEVEKSGFKEIFYFINQKANDTMDVILANTIYGLGSYLDLIRPDMLVIHGDRVEALAGSIVGALNNTLVAHIEGGEVSGAIDESIRHSVSKLSHIHFVANNEAKKRLLQMGEEESRIFIIGSPDIDLMISPDLPSLSVVKEYYGIPFEEYSILVYHPVTTNLHNLLTNIRVVLDAVLRSGCNYIITYPNNDIGADIIIEEYKQLNNNQNIRIFPSVRFEYFLVLLRNCQFVMGNSSAGVREAPFYAIPSINIGDRQNKRFLFDTIINTDESGEDILNAIKSIKHVSRVSSNHFGDGNSSEKFLNVLKHSNVWEEKVQKFFIDRS
jgi:UDP-N-acetylglucosamine 2-epimerase (hydrolysing)